jgi:4'-phosphopantetheinyl transferase
VSAFDLKQRSVDLWGADLEAIPATEAEIRGTLSADELARSGQFLSESHRQWFEKRRYLLRLLLARYTGTRAADVELGYERRGKPELRGSSELQFSLAHSHGRAMYGFARQARIGVDLELIHTDVEGEQLASSFFTPDETAALRRTPSAQRPEAFYRLWAAKEAFVKASGEGLSRPLQSFDIQMAGELEGAVVISGDEQESGRWQIYWVKPFPVYLAAVAVEKPCRLTGLRLIDVELMRELRGRD